MAKDLNQAVREVCLSFPEAEEFLSHGSPNFRVRGKTFATYVVNHHGDRRIALWLNAPPGAQEQHTRTAPKQFFVPPYVGPRGWLGVQLDKGLSWKRIAALVREAYEKVAPPALIAQIGRTIEIESPTKSLAPSEIDPMSSKRAQAKALKLAFWVGVDRQGLLTADERFQIPQYMGHNGWIALDVTRHCDWEEVRTLALDSYRHFALRRMRAALGEV